MDKKKTGKFIKERRVEKGMTQSQLADILGVSNKAVSRWETGNSFPDITLFCKLSEMLDVNVDELILGEKINKPTVIRKSRTKGKPDFARFDMESADDKKQAYRKFLGHQYVKEEVLKLRPYLLVAILIMIVAISNLVFVEKYFINLAVEIHMHNEKHMSVNFDEIIISEYIDGFEGYEVRIIDGKEELQTLFVSDSPIPVLGRFLPGNIRCLECGLPG